MKLGRPGHHKGLGYVVDLSSMAEVEKFTDQVIKDSEQFGGIDYLVLSAGGPPSGEWRGPTSEVLLYGKRS